MSTETSNYNLVKPETSDPVDIQAHWNDNLVIADSALKTQEDSLPVSNFEIWQTTLSERLVHDATGSAYTGAIGNWTLMSGHGDSIFDPVAAVGGEFTFLNPGLYKINCNSEVSINGDPTESRIELVFWETNLVTFVPGLRRSMHGALANGGDISIAIDTVMRIYEAGLPGTQPWEFDVDNLFKLAGQWQSNPTSVEASMLSFSTWIQVERLRD